ncbi:MAG: phosphatidylglycerol lysyltransferase domain-containing protein [Ruminiclostridium sp.]|nr:phosphatidylglycerol lysyltransferase domain-containing protein [Ruminiclostridium sp.]
MLDWRTPTPGDIPEMRRLAGKAGARGSDASAVNIYLLREKYNIKAALIGGFLFRLYTGTRLPGRCGVTFPLGCGDIGAALDLLAEDCRERGKPLCFIFLTEEQRDIVAAHFPDMRFGTDEGNSDYTYTAKHLAELTGKENEKKRNRVNRFTRLYPDMKLVFSEDTDPLSFTRDMISVAERWFDEQAERVDSMFVERLEIYEACRCWTETGLLGAVLYADEIPAAMTIASEISPGNYDIHFEKCWGEYAKAGGFAAINKLFAAHLAEKHGALWINREEDIGLEGLRRAKSAYRPDKMLVKYHTLGGCTEC